MSLTCTCVNQVFEYSEEKKHFNSGAGCGENHAHLDTSVKLCPNIHNYELFENFSLANPN